MKCSNYYTGDTAILLAIKLGIIKVDLETGVITTDKGVLNGKVQSMGYRQIVLQDPFTPGRRMFVYNHRVVYIAKCLENNEPIPTSDYQIDHINGDKGDNRAVNLRAVTIAENCQNPNTLLTGDRNPHTKINLETKKKICELHDAGMSYTKIIQELQLPICKQRASQIYTDMRRYQETKICKL